MSVAALSTALAIATAPVQGGGPSPATSSPDVAPAAAVVALQSADEAPDIRGQAKSGESIALLAGELLSIESQSAQPTPASDLPQTDEPLQQTNPDLSAKPESQLLPPPMDPSDIVVTGRRPSPDDPLEELNATSFEVTQSVDKAIVAPIAYAYEDIMPRPIRKGLSNFLHNLGEPVVFLNYMLQLKPGKAAETVGRFVINTTVGAAGIVDVAKRKPFNLPHRKNGFANTLGYYGVPQGPYFYLPLIGPTTLRDFIGNRLDVLIFPLALGNQFSRPDVLIPVAALNELNARIEFDDELREIRATRDPYVAARSYYLRRRQAEIDALHGRGDGTVPVIAPPAASTKAAPSSPAPPEKPAASSAGL